MHFREALTPETRERTIDVAVVVARIDFGRHLEGAPRIGEHQLIEERDAEIIEADQVLLVEPGRDRTILTKFKLDDLRSHLDHRIVDTLAERPVGVMTIE